MMKTSMALTAIAALGAAGVIGCSAPDESIDDDGAASSELSTSALSENIARLRALRVFHAAPIQDSVPEAAVCYRFGPTQTSIGLICPEMLSYYEGEIAAGDRRLAAFVGAAEAAAALPDAIVASDGTNLNSEQVARDLATLRSLHIVDVGNFILDDPEGSTCYQTFCERSDAVRAGKLHDIVKAAQTLAK
jgi:hypothetical protein